ncbi:GNAT family N-acetyltransferase [Escherichia coli]|nr:GNAT family N-acetyltransferase [Escherichia coli]
MADFRIADPFLMPGRFTRWMNDPRVEYFWEQKWLTGGTDRLSGTPARRGHAFPLIGCFDDRPFSYFGNLLGGGRPRLVATTSWRPAGRSGLHLLVGEQQWRGAHYVRSWLRGVTRYLLLNEPRTQRTVLEPRTDNQRLFRHLRACGIPDN